MGEEEKEGLTEEEKCRIAWEVALDEALRVCGGREEAFKTFGELLGLSGEEANDLSHRAEEILERGLTKDICYDFRGIRRWVMAKAWDLMEKERIPFREAIRRAWAEAKRECAELGAYI